MERAAIVLERNVTDNDMEIRLEVSGSAEGFARLQVTAPDGRQILDLSARDSRLGLRQVTLESPEPTNGAGVLADFPAGTYRFSGTTVAGMQLEADATLNHTVPKATSILSPKPDERDVAVKGVELRWTQVPEVAGYVVSIEHERSGQELTARLPASITTLPVPNGFLVGGRTYKVNVGALARDGNRTFVEMEFSTSR